MTRTKRSQKPKELLPPAAVAQKCGVTPSTIRLWERLGLIRAEMKTTHGMRLFTEQEVARVVARRATEGRKTQ